jgi:hypothetical protein
LSASTAPGCSPTPLASSRPASNGSSWAHGSTPPCPPLMASVSSSAAPWSGGCGQHLPSLARALCLSCSRRTRRCGHVDAALSSSSSPPRFCHLSDPRLPIGSQACRLTNWILQDPARSEETTLLEGGTIQSWSITHPVAELQPGDRAALWVSGKYAGFYVLGEALDSRSRIWPERVGPKKTKVT